ncbi:hypothetical protein ACFU5O_27925 [Streptomyces sp. NPDC057445]|uniref:hypothetical protein n=1 Tax=Streptomyces sp. NPDC057445 TaxID=3346136 RepID=UPI00369DADD3
MPRIRPGRVRTKRTNGRPALMLSTMDPQHFNVRSGEVKSVVCPDCMRWRRLTGETTLKIREHCAPGCVPEGKRHQRCNGSSQLVVVDICIRAWTARQNRLAREAVPADQRRAARQYHKAMPTPAPPVTKLKRRPPAAPEVLTAYRTHFKRCAGCEGSARCPDGLRLAALYAHLARQQARRDALRATLARERIQFDRLYLARAARKAATEWMKHHQATLDTKRFAKRSGTAIEETNNICGFRPKEAASEFRGPDLPLEPVRTTT